MKGNIGILVHTKYFRVINNGQALYVLAVLPQGLGLGRIINTRLGVPVVVVHGVGRKECFEYGPQTPLIPEVSDTAAVRDLGSDVLERVPRDVALAAKHLEVEQGRLAVRIRELVLDVPAERAELLALLDDGVEEANAEHDLAPLVAQNILLEEGLGYFGEGALDVGAQALRRLIRHLDREYF